MIEPVRSAVAWRAALIFLALAVTGCATHTGQNPGLIPPKVSQPTAIGKELRTIPGPAEPVRVAVYGLEDLTGQFKERENVQSLSRSVSQGAGSMLVQSLITAGQRTWFTVVERESLDDLLRERQIITEMRRIYQNDTDTSADELPPLLVAPIIISGGIVGFDSNNITGGAGARFLGIGANTKYQQDTVTVNLRAVSTKTGEVLSSVTTNKAIASYALQSGAFRYIALDELLELEAGVTANEPGQIALQQALDKAIYGLIVDGVMLGIWNFADPAAETQIVDAWLTGNYSPDDRPVYLRPVQTTAPTALQQIPLDAIPATGTPRPPPYSADEAPLG